MGFTPLDGLMMGTRSGTVDPGILTFLMRQGQLDAKEIDAVLNHKSGLLGVSGLSGDMRDILAAMEQGHARAKLAFDVYVHRLRAAIAAMAAALGGMDALVFTAGVGENSSAVRAAASISLEFLGLNARSSGKRAANSRRGHFRGRFKGPCPGDSSGRGLGHRGRMLEAAPPTCPTILLTYSTPIGSAYIRRWTLQLSS